MTDFIDPIFDLPEGLEGLEYKKEPLEQIETEEIEDFFGTGLGEEEYADTTAGEVSPAPSELEGDDEPLLPPDNVVIVDRIVRIDHDGNTVVDVVVDVDGDPGTMQYDVRLTKR